jgi:hypothetical protein
MVKLAGTTVSILIFAFASAAQGQIVSLTAREYEKGSQVGGGHFRERVRRVYDIDRNKNEGADHKQVASTSRNTFRLNSNGSSIRPFRRRLSDGRNYTDRQLGFSEERETLRGSNGPVLRLGALAPQPVSSCGTFAGELGSYGSGKTKLEGQVTRFLSRNAETNMQGLVLQEVCRVLISSDGVLLKIEIETIEGDSKEWVKRIVSTWAYDPSIRIEAPIK